MLGITSRSPFGNRNRQRVPPDCYVVGPVAKEALWKRLKKNFVLPEPEVASDEEVEPDEAELKRRRDRIEANVRHFAEKRWLRHSATGRKS